MSPDLNTKHEVPSSLKDFLSTGARFWRRKDKGNFGEGSAQLQTCSCPHWYYVPIDSVGDLDLSAGIIQRAV